MEAGRTFQGFVHPVLDWMNEAFEYTIDTWQRMILFTDVIRQQGTNFIDENEKGLPPVLEFDYQVIFDGRDLDRPVNYALARIMPEEGVDIPDEARPIVIIDPRAGHGPGVGGFKKESEVGIAMKNRHPVYFMIFSQFPVPGQTLADVTDAEIQFIEVVGRFHPKADKPVVIGNCQAGWATALLAADRPDITGPIILNGSPLSYWAGKDVQNPMRYKGGLLGGMWAASLCADLGNGNFDGANLVKGFEDLNPANTFWKKKYHLYSNVDTEAERFLHFEKWWNGFFFLTSEEIQFITRDLFVGNKLEEGNVSFEEGKKIDLKNLKEPIIVFASEGDNITPPQQALNWVRKVWGSDEGIRRANQVIIYLLHKDIGHLGIFVSSKVVKKEHNEMIRNVDLIQYLTPGLYQMVIDDEAGENGEPHVRYESRKIDDILEMSDEKGEDEFWYVRKISDLNEQLYQQSLGPVVRMMSNDFSAGVLRNSHSLRVERYLFSDLNPSLIPVKSLAPLVRKNRIKLSGKSIYKMLEEAAAETISTSLEYCGNINDVAQVFSFYNLYSNPVLPMIFGKAEELPVQEKSVPPEIKFRDWKQFAGFGGKVEGMIRALVAINSVKLIRHKPQLQFVKKLVDAAPFFIGADKETVYRIISEQAKILKADFDYAVSKIPELILTPEDRLVAIEILRCSIADDHIAGKEEKALLSKLEKLLDDRKTL